MRLLLLAPLISLSGCLATLPNYTDYSGKDSATIRFNLDTTAAWTPFGKALSVEMYNGCTTQRLPINGNKENALGRLTVKNDDLGSKAFSIPTDKTLYIWAGIPNGCGGPMALTAEPGGSYELSFYSRSTAQCSVDIYKIVNGKKEVTNASRSVRRKGLIGDESYSWRKCDYLESIDKH